MAKIQKLQSSTIITRYLKPGRNLIALEVYRWTTGSYLECQDFWRISGIERDVYLFAQSPVYLRDFAIRQDLDNTYKNGIFRAGFMSNKRQSTATGTGHCILSTGKSLGHTRGGRESHD